MSSSRKILFLVLLFAFLVRVTGVGYGLPLWLVSDEPPFVLGALKMIELKTLILRSNVSEFASVLYYPPYISYLLLPTFSVILALKYMLFSGDRPSFINYIGADLSSFFLAARFLNTLLATFLVYLVYRVSKNIFEDEWGAVAGSFFIATSLLNILLSLAARQWLAVSFIFLLVLYFLTKKSLSFRKRYFLSVLTAGLGMGISAISAFLVIMLTVYFLLFEEKKLFDFLRERFSYILMSMFIVLAALPILIYPASIGFGGKISLFSDKSAFALLASSVNFISPLLFAEPVLILAALAGLAVLFAKKRKLFWFFAIFIFAYSAVFYIFFRFEDRFLSPLIPFFAILAGFGFSWLFSHQRLAAVFLIFPLIFSLRLGYLSYENDSRENLRVWIERNISAHAKIIVDARLMRLSSDKSGIEEQSKIDSGSLRQVDRSELFFGESPVYPSFHALNLDSIRNQEFLANLRDYAKKNSYEYLASSKSENGAPIVQFGSNARISITDSRLAETPWELFETKQLGPEVSLYNLK